MESEITRLVEQYETGRVSRRQLVAGLGSLVAIMGGAGHVLAAPQDKKEEQDDVEKIERAKPTFQGLGLNHIALRVTDIARSRDFYRKHLGLRVIRQSPSNCFLTCGKNFVALFKSKTAGMHHYCYSIKDYDVRKVEQTLKTAGFKPRVAGNRIYFPDPDGLTVQLASVSHTATRTR